VLEAGKRGMLSAALLLQQELDPPPMSVDAATVRKIAHLARLKLDEADVEPMKNELNGILAWIEQLGEVDTTTVEPMASVVSMKLNWRKDVVDADPLTGGGKQADVLKNAPQAEYGFYAVPKVIE
jgi:aspartyl-tRNA(Asn)/glutamyl-tRNA(Gln) amidotransferase subunit C